MKLVVNISICKSRLSFFIASSLQLDLFIIIYYYKCIVAGLERQSTEFKYSQTGVKWTPSITQTAAQVPFLFPHIYCKKISVFNRYLCEADADTLNLTLAFMVISVVKNLC